MKIYESKYVIRTIDSDSNIMKSVWLSATGEMSEEEFKQTMLLLTEQIEAYKIKHLLSDTKDLGFPIDPEMQKWIHDEIAPKFVAAKLDKQAIIIPDEIFAQVSMQQTVGDIEADGVFISRFFNNEKDAIEWLSNE